jgi:electron transfer flavoprotein alpha subunit
MNKRILVFVEVESGSISNNGIAALKGASLLQGKLGGVALLGALSQKVTVDLNELSTFGIEEVYVPTEEVGQDYNSLITTTFLKKALTESGASVLLGVASSLGKDLFPRVAGSLDKVGMASDVTDFGSIQGDTGMVSFIRPVFAGDYFAEVKINSSPLLVTVRASSFVNLSIEPKAFSGEVKVNEILDKYDGSNGTLSILGTEVSKSERPELSSAKVVVSGGRALGSKENFEKYIFPLADKLGAAIGASRAAVDAGYAPNDWQVGQTGKVVAPDLYIALGISGAIQHLAGMKDSKVIVAINRDGDAPIMELADYTLVGDLFKIIPELTDAIFSK